MSQHVSDGDLRLMLFCAFRYSLGRKSYMPSEARDLVRKYVHALSADDLDAFDVDIGKAAQRQQLGADPDLVEGWLRFRQWLRDSAAEKRGTP